MRIIDEKAKKIILGFQKNEITEYYVYRALARFVKDENNRLTLERIADEEMRNRATSLSASTRRSPSSRLGL